MYSELHWGTGPLNPARLLALVKLESPVPCVKSLFDALRESSATCPTFTRTFCWRGMCRFKEVLAPSPSAPKVGLKSHAWGAPVDHYGG